MGENYALELRDISKRFGSVQANDHVNATPQPTETALQTYGGGNGYASKSADSYAAASKPRTGDETEIGLYLAIAILAGMSGLVGFAYKKGNKKQLR